MRIITQGYHCPFEFNTDSIGHCFWWSAIKHENDDSFAFIHNYEPNWSNSMYSAFLTCGIYVRCIADI